MEMSYRKLKIWELSVILVKKVYKISEELPKSEEHNLKIQLKRAVTSVTINIVEGKSRKSPKEFSNFLNISMASLGEVHAILSLCEELGYIKSQQNIYSDIINLGMKINALRKKLEDK